MNPLPILLQAADMGSLLGNATSSIGTYMVYLPYALGGAVAVALLLVFLARKNAAKSGGAAVGGLASGMSGVSVSGSMGGGKQGPVVINMMIIYSRIQRRVIGFRPFRVDRKTDPSGNILEKRAVYLDTKKGVGMVDKISMLFSRMGAVFGRKPQQGSPDEEEGILFTESLAIGSPGGGWIASITLEENAQVPMFPNESTNLNLAEEVKRINEQYDKRISRLKDAALSINQYANSANSLMGQAISKGLLIFGVLVMVSILVLFYGLSQLGSIIASTGHIIATARNMTV